MGVSEYPFYNDIRMIKGKHKSIVKFIETFMKDFDNNYILIKNWTDEAHNKFMEKLNTENSFLDLLDKKFDVVFNIKKNKSII